MTQKEWVVLGIHKSLKERMIKAKTHPRDSYSDIIEKLLNEHDGKGFVLDEVTKDTFPAGYPLTDTTTSTSTEF